MNRKLMTLFAALAAFAALAVVPALASANNLTLRDDANVHVAVGTKIIGTSGNLKYESTNGVFIRCAENIMTGEVTENAGSVTGTITSSTHRQTPTNPHCESSLGNASITAVNLNWCLKAGTKYVPTTDTAILDSCNAGQNVKFKATITPFGFSVATCALEVTSTAGNPNGNINATYNTGGSLTMTVEATTPEWQRVTNSPESCGTEGNLTGSFSLFRDNSGAAGTALRAATS